MRLKHLAALLAVGIPVYFLIASGRQTIPADLRDAVADGALDELAGSREQADAPAVPAAAAPERADESKSIYGKDDRLDYYQAPAAQQALARSVVSLWRKTDIAIEGDTATLKTMNFGQKAGLCPGETFAEQPIGAFCSGSLIKDDVIMTAGHCITDQARCDSTSFVFGFQLDKAAQDPKEVKASDVYQCKSIIKRDLDVEEGGIWHSIVSVWNGGPGPDFALIRLDRKVTGRTPLAIHRNARPAKGDKLFVIGHPVGLPLKVAGGAKVRDAGPKYFFNADLDTFGGNSGSAVFNASTNQIEGILVRGDTDFVDSPAGCRVAAVYPQNGGKGEAVTKISVVQPFIP